MMFIPEGIIPQHQNMGMNAGTFDTLDLVALDVHDNPNELTLELMLRSGHTICYKFKHDEKEILDRLVRYFRHVMGSNAFRDIPFREYENMITQQVNQNGQTE